jgi:hypothetical protein
MINIIISLLNLKEGEKHLEVPYVQCLLTALRAVLFIALLRTVWCFKFRFNDGNERRVYDNIRRLKI